MTMTTAGLCNLIITGLDLAEGKAVLLADGSAENCGEYSRQRAGCQGAGLDRRLLPRRTLDDETARQTFDHPFYACTASSAPAG